MTFEVGDVVCVHEDPAYSDDADNNWIGVVSNVAGITYVKQLGRTQVSQFVVHQHELRPTVLTFEGPVCVECRHFH